MLLLSQRTVNARKQPKSRDYLVRPQRELHMRLLGGDVLGEVTEGRTHWPIHVIYSGKLGSVSWREQYVFHHGRRSRAAEVIAGSLLVDLFHTYYNWCSAIAVDIAIPNG